MVTVLVVDDDAAIARLIRLFLATEGIHVESAGSGEEALAYLGDGHIPPDLILLDLNMPGMDGRQVYSAARDAGVACPIVFCSAYGAVTAKQQLGAEGAIEKPFEPEHLLSAIRALTG